jgi:hypothetical protein
MHTDMHPSQLPNLKFCSRQLFQNLPVMLKLESISLTSATCKVFKFPRNVQFKILCDLTAEAIQIHYNYLPCNAWSTLTATSCTA